MQRTRLLWITNAVLAVLLFVRLVAGGHDEAPRLLPGAPEEVERIEIEGDAPVVLVREEGRWWLDEEGGMVPADASKVTRFLSFLYGFLRSDAVTEDPAAYGELGLEPGLRVVVRVEGVGRVGLVFGAVGEVPRTQYVRLEEERVVYRVDASAGFYATRGPRFWREVRPWGGVAPDEVLSVRIEWKGGLLFLARSEQGGGEVWVVRRGDRVERVGREDAVAYLAALTEWEAEDVAAQDGVEGEGQVVVEWEDGRVRRWVVGEEGERVVVWPEGAAYAYFAPPASFSRLLEGP
ncbi:DUF4340 domain-containing protein [Spirochaeta thermophila]|uniref:DUF4340 domain-containing protein n=1 Tax=Winmispira thermophila (strain ATCC 49972 / DSM 6192 / RI 19.B1) TaxID=665571 RepID=E0RN79_WINT6|nr:DUF4340 domain-containing protein [Spirochaeta thermophila]ADN02548.1 hypothetical protein STHERM_c16080 [Spirochaeta thermophila DSM 6192]